VLLSASRLSQITAAIRSSRILHREKDGGVPDFGKRAA
jgi:hypothetical protein